MTQLVNHVRAIQFDHITTQVDTLLTRHQTHLRLVVRIRHIFNIRLTLVVILRVINQITILLSDHKRFIY